LTLTGVFAKESRPFVVSSWLLASLIESLTPSLAVFIPSFNWEAPEFISFDAETNWEEPSASLEAPLLAEARPF